MVLDIFDKENDKLIFKNTYDQDGQPKQVEVGRTHSNAPEELYFVHIEVKDMDKLTVREDIWLILKQTSSTYINDHQLHKPQVQHVIIFHFSRVLQSILIFNV